MIDYATIRKRMAKAKDTLSTKKFALIPLLSVDDCRCILDALNDEALLIDRCQKSDEYSKTGPSPQAKESHGDTKVAAELLKLKVEQLILSPGDLVVLTTPNTLSMEAVKAIRRIFESACIVPDVRTIVLTEGVEIGHVVKSCVCHFCRPACNAPHLERVPLTRIADGLRVWC